MRPHGTAFLTPPCWLGARYLTVLVPVFCRRSPHFLSQVPHQCCERFASCGHVEQLWGAGGPRAQTPPSPWARPLWGNWLLVSVRRAGSAQGFSPHCSLRIRTVEVTVLAGDKVPPSSLLSEGTRTQESGSACPSLLGREVSLTLTAKPLPHRLGRARHAELDPGRQPLPPQSVSHVTGRTCREGPRVGTAQLGGASAGRRPVSEDVGPAAAGTRG